MTNVEAIKELQESHDMMRSYNIDENESRLMTALNMAIQALSSWEEYSDKLWKEAYERGKTEALSQEPCDDAISRKDAEQMFRNIRGHLKPQDYKSAEEFNTRDLMLLNAEQMIHALPSVTQKSDEQLYKNGFADGYEQGYKDAKQKSGNPQPSEHFIDGVHAVGYREGYKDAQKQKSGKWIPVSERLPEVGISILVCDVDSDIYFTHITRDSVFFDEWGNKIKGVVAWMPLPKPYEPQESEDKE